MVSVCKDLRSDPQSIVSGQQATWILDLVTNAGPTDQAHVEYTINNPPEDDVRFGNGTRTMTADFSVNHVCLPYSAPYAMIGTFSGLVQVTAVVNNGQDQSIGGVQFN
jgi:hypothetical protein